MNHFRDFSSSQQFEPATRNIDADAPDGMRHELIDLVFHIVEHNSPPLSDKRMYQIICQSLGKKASGQPYGGFRYATGRDLGKADWRRVYDLICRLWPEFAQAGVSDDYREGVNKILSAYKVVWELGEEGRLRRVLSATAQSRVDAAIAELTASCFAPALELFKDAMNAFDDRPRRDRDACANIFDAMESVAKEVFNLPNEAFGAVLRHIRQNSLLHKDIITVFEAINTLRNRNFGHGTPFKLSSTEVDFVYLACIGAIPLFAREEWVQV